MNEKLLTANLVEVIARRTRPGITVWNRLEGRPRAENFERALQAEVRDPLWMLTRQWQMGEFRGDDAGSPIFAKTHVETRPFDRFQPASGPVEAFPETLPLESRVEPLPIAFGLGKTTLALDLRLLMGRYWLKLMNSLAPAARSQYIAAYRIDAPDPTVLEAAAIAAHPEALAHLHAVAGRCMDGGKLYLFLKADPANRASAGIAALAGQEAAADDLGQRFVDWFDGLIAQPAEQSAFIPEHLEYQFSCSTADGPSDKVYTAEEYFHGHLDWYNFDVDPRRASLDGAPPTIPAADPATSTLTVLPTNVTFNGMPNTRWWAFEDGQTNFGDIKPDTTDLAKLLLIEFGLVYANDWFLIPFTVPAGSVAKVRGIAVTNVFGERIWVEPAGAGDNDDWQRWGMFQSTVLGPGGKAELGLVVPPAAQKTIEAAPLEEILFVRDEMANMVWGIEKTFPSPTGAPKAGSVAATETRHFFEAAAKSDPGDLAPPPAPGAKIRYKLMSSVPEHWIPMVPAHAVGSGRETELQRAGMLRILDGAAPVKVRPRTPMLYRGLERDPAQALFVHEEEIPRAGVRVTASYQRTRWRDGRVWLWYGMRKQTGRGEGSSGLAFDRIVPMGDT
ncbi:hypothetical protein [Mesorhizobium sp. CO1-1-8]|uniref:hypothetical protein n=1 Tax=Mesorhizobium sp. CO1-1-8 TaxID=2876631 RepID=UPI001CD0923A|nr:hypothetical protein [Mesorhizobium sp. CO1-1-8]MBZ9772619.1 hypothetical protein [Mesorhizobium sp. CO1-1-8]